MGLIKAGIGALGGTLADQWKEFFYCDSLDSDILMIKGQKRTSGRSSNTKGEENIISNGSGIAVADGQCMMIVEQGKIVEVCAEPGEFTYDSSTEPSIFTGPLGASVKETFKTIGRRFTYGGDTGKDQRVYYFNTKEILDNKFGTREPVPFRVVDRNIGLDVDISVRLNGVFSYKIADPLVFYTNVCGNVAEEYRRDTLDSMLKPELLTHLGPALAKISAMGIRYSALPGHNMEIRDALKAELTEEWFHRRGIEVVNVAINSAAASDEDEEMIKQLQRTEASTHRRYMRWGSRLSSRTHSPRPEAAGSAPAVRRTAENSARTAESPNLRRIGCVPAEHGIRGNSARNAANRNRNNLNFTGARRAAGPRRIRRIRRSFARNAEIRFAGTI